MLSTQLGGKARPKVSGETGARHFESKGAEGLPGLETRPGQWDVWRATHYGRPWAVGALDGLLRTVDREAGVLVDTELLHSFISHVNFHVPY